MAGNKSKTRQSKIAANGGSELQDRALRSVLITSEEKFVVAMARQ